MATIMRHTPNILSAFRIALVGVFVWLFRLEAYWWALGVYLLAFFTDILDGYLARRNNWISNIGKLLDPLADKLLILAAMICYASLGWIPLYIVIAELIKELLMIVGGVFMLKYKIVVYADTFGKISAGLLHASIVFTIVEHFVQVITPWHIVVFIISVLLAYVSMANYFFKNVYPVLKKGNKK